ncbi:serine/threonine protein phosphatase 1 [Roseovarius tolerans]|uniref:Serine/threonine protein phosphatase 1 n=1 Tax=Roseovarius tolerans TaxID=74031 RepID=A0A1H7UN79_9RHOB|nr:metallophosphoesterase [Roseovarius tolerans]SEL98413.1 serine/threonine protein phosphatase 1 [Roseovarius tolerans]
MKFLKSLFSTPREMHCEFGRPAPLSPLAAIGDIHGRADLLEQLLARLEPDLQVICVGDYVDRGDHSADVLRILHANPDIICLKGNHEEMLLNFIQQPETYGRRWFRNGGLQTMASFGIAGLTQTSSDDRLRTVRDALVKAMGDPLIDWLDGLQSGWRVGNLAVVHAGADPALPLEAQPGHVLRWGHPDFMTTPRSDGVWVIHGHTIVSNPVMDQGRVAIDTGAYASGRLTAAVVTDGDIHFETT